MSVTAVLYGDRRWVDLGYPGADDRPDRGMVQGDIQVAGNRVSLRMSTGTLPSWTPLGDFEWEAKAFAGGGGGPSGQYTDCAPEQTEHIAHPSGRLVRFTNGRGGC